MFNKRHAIAILIAACFLVYFNSIPNAFVSDDIPAIVQNPTINRPFDYWLIPAAFLNSLNYLIGGDNPAIYHITSIILHSLFVVMVFYFLRLFYEVLPAFFGALLFAVHPIHTEAVTWVSGKPYILISIVSLGILLLYVNGRGKWRYPSALAIFSCYIIKNYNFVIFIPVILILYDVIFNRWRKYWKLWIPFLAIAATRVFLLSADINDRIITLAKGFGSQAVIWTNPLYNAVYTIFKSLLLFIWPQSLTLYHEPAVITQNWLNIEILGLIIGILFLPYLYKRNKPLLLGLGIFVVFLSPSYSPYMISWLVAERYLYFPSILTGIVLACFCERYAKNRIALAMIIFIISAMGIRTVIRNEDWRSPDIFWRKTAQVSPLSHRAHNNMGDIYCQEGNVEGAIKEFSKAIELRPDYADAYYNLGITYYRQGDRINGDKFYQKAIEINPRLKIQ